MSLDQKLRDRIQANGPMPVEDWMAACLGDPEHGYYMTRDPLGARGDFTTAPEISQMFGELLGLWAAVVWQQMGQPSQVSLVELGPGRGTLMADALRAARGVPGFIDALHVHMVETSPVLRARQQAALGNVTARASWHASINDLPDGPMILIANEFLDALPVRQAVASDGAWYRRVVTLRDGRFVFEADRSAPATWVPEHKGPVVDGDVFEDQPAAADTVAVLAKRLVDRGGGALFIDYGHTQTSAGETLQALRSHGFADPLTDLGNADLTVHVDFDAMARAARSAGARVWGPVEQGTLLERLGIGARAANLLANATREQAVDIGTARQRLTAPEQMGRLFHAMALSAPGRPAPPGFESVSWA